MFQYNPNANYQPNGGQYLQILLGKDLHKQTIVISRSDTSPARFLNIFVHYPLGSMKVGDKLWTNWKSSYVIMANTVKLCGVVHIKCLWGQF